MQDGIKLYLLSAHLDLSYIKENVTDDEEFISTLLQVFLHSLDPDRRDLNEGIDSGDHESIKRAAHKLKSSFRSLGMRQPWTLLQEIEDIGHHRGSLDEIVRKKIELDYVIPKVVKEVNKYLKDNA